MGGTTLASNYFVHNPTCNYRKVAGTPRIQRPEGFNITGESLIVDAECNMRCRYTSL
jgi:hypothetical protein